MKIGINASFLRKPFCGIGQVTTHFLQTLINKANAGELKNVEIILYLEEALDWSLPEQFSKKVLLPWYRRDDLIRKIWFEKFLLPKAAERDGCDVLFSLYQSASIVQNIPHVMLVHDAIWKIFPKYLNNLRKKVYYSFVDQAIRQVDEIITVSHCSKKDITEIFRIEKEKITVSYIDCDPIFKQRVIKDYSAKLQTFGIQGDFIFYFGGLDERKNVERLINAYAKFYSEQSEKQGIVDLVIGGHFHPQLVPLVTDLPKVTSQVEAKYHLPKGKIKMIGFVKQEDLPALYCSARAFVYPSLYEGFGMPVLEAMHSGVPIITSKTSSIVEIITPQAALMVDPRNEEEIKEALEKILSDQNLREGLALRAKQEANKFSWEKFTDSVLAKLLSIS